MRPESLYIAGDELNGWGNGDGMGNPPQPETPPTQSQEPQEKE